MGGRTAADRMSTRFTYKKRKKGDFIMKHSALLKTTAAMGAALTMTCAMATGAFADQVYSISDATISVGQTWSFSYSGYMDWLLSSEYIEHGPNMADTEGVLKYVSTETTGRMTTVTYEAMMPGTCTVTLMDRSFIGGEIDKATVTVTGDGQTSTDDSWDFTGPGAGDTTKPDDTKTDDTTKADDTKADDTAKGDNAKTDTVKPAAPAASSEDNTPAVATRTAQQKEIDEAIANGTWGIEYTTCQKCGYHNWTRQGNVYVCDTCGNETTTVVGPKGVKGYVGSGAIAAVAPKASAPETRYATAAEAQAAADKREAAYAAAVTAFQKQIAAQNAAYLAALGK